MTPRQRRLRGTRGRARRVLSSEVRSGDVLHVPSGAVEVLAVALSPATVAFPHGCVEMVIRDEYPTGDTLDRTLRLSHSHTMLVAKKGGG